jgi:hypothetical protein
MCWQEWGGTDLSNEDDDLIHKTLQYPFTQLGGMHELMQGFQSYPCPNPRCENSEFEGRHSPLMVAAVVWNQPISGVELWSPDPKYPYNSDVQNVYEICPKCRSLLAYNRCT